jgi:hypothetical protein
MRAIVIQHVYMQIAPLQPTYIGFNAQNKIKKHFGFSIPSHEIHDPWPFI